MIFRWWRLWREVPGAIGAGFRMVNERLSLVLELLRLFPSPPSIPIIVSVSGIDAEGHFQMFSEVKWFPREKLGTLEVDVDPMCALDQLCVAISTDVSRLEIRGIFAGTWLLGKGYPFARHHRALQAGERVRVQVAIPREP